MHEQEICTSIKSGWLKLSHEHAVLTPTRGPGITLLRTCKYISTFGTPLSAIIWDGCVYVPRSARIVQRTVYSPLLHEHWLVLEIHMKGDA